MISPSRHILSHVASGGPTLGPLWLAPPPRPVSPVPPAGELLLVRARSSQERARSNAASGLLPQRPFGTRPKIRPPTDAGGKARTTLLVPHAGGCCSSHPAAVWQCPWASAMALPRKPSWRSRCGSVSYRFQWLSRTRLRVPSAGAINLHFALGILRSSFPRPPSPVSRRFSGLASVLRDLTPLWLWACSDRGVGAGRSPQVY